MKYSQKNGPKPALWGCDTCGFWCEVPSNACVPLCPCDTPEYMITDDREEWDALVQWFLAVRRQQEESAREQRA